MSQTDLFMDEVGTRCGVWLRQAWPGSRVKNTARVLDLSEAQAKRLVGGARKAPPLPVNAERQMLAHAAVEMKALAEGLHRGDAGAREAATEIFGGAA